MDNDPAQHVKDNVTDLLMLLVVKRRVAPDDILAGLAEAAATAIVAIGGPSSEDLFRQHFDYRFNIQKAKEDSRFRP